MKTVSVSRPYDVPAAQIRSVFEDVTTFFDAAGFGVQCDADLIDLTKRISVAEMELKIRLRDDLPAALAYEQVAGPFETMEARYVVDQAPTWSRLTIETSFEVPPSGFGAILSKEVIERQRQGELDAVASLLEENDASSKHSSQGHGLNTEV